MRRHIHPSTVVAIVAWGTAGFLALPSFWSYLIHFSFLPCLIALALWLRHHETYRQARESHEQVKH